MQNEKSQRRFDGLPLDDPRVVTWVLSDHEDRLNDLETKDPAGMVETPWGKFPWWMALLAVGALAVFFPKEFSALLHRAGL